MKIKANFHNGISVTGKDVQKKKHRKPARYK